MTTVGLSRGKLIQELDVGVIGMKQERPVKKTDMKHSGSICDPIKTGRKVRRGSCVLAGNVFGGLEQPWAGLSRGEGSPGKESFCSA